MHDIVEGDVPLRDFDVRAFRLRHPGTTLGYRLSPIDGGREIAYLTDNELGPGGTYPVSADWRARLVQFLAGTDTLIHDAMYSDQFIQVRAGWGHSTPRQAVDLAAEAACARLILFHHEPENDDETIDALLGGCPAACARGGAEAGGGGGQWKAAVSPCERSGHARGRWRAA